jgi:hypothetical protein
MIPGARMLTLYQPWATLVARGHKLVETRGWSTSYRGLLLIHAGRSWSRRQACLCQDEPFASAIGIAPKDRWRMPTGVRPGRVAFGLTLPIGSIVAVARLADCRPTGRQHRLTGWQVEPWVVDLGREEQAFGDFGTGRFGWFLAEVRPLDEPLPCRGHQGLRPPSDPGIVAEALRRAGVEP